MSDPLEVNDEELEALIQFQEDCLRDALDSCEHEEARIRETRIKELRTIRKQRNPAWKRFEQLIGE